MMKRLPLLFLLFIYFKSIANKPVIVSSASIFNDMVKNIGGDFVEAYSIVPIGGDPHIYEATPADAKLLLKANAILINGLTFEGWINEIIQNSGTKAKTFTITEGIVPIKSAQHNGATDPHAWMDAENGLIYIKNIRDALIATDPSHANEYEKNYNNYKKKIESLHQNMFSKIQNIPKEKRILITSHDAFSYFGNKYGMKIIAMMGVSTEADAQTSDMERVIKAIKDYHIPAIFVESTINPKLLQQVSKDQQVAIGGNLYADSIGEEGTDGGSYIGMLTHNVEVIHKGLTSFNDSVNEGSQEVKYWMYGLLIMVLILSWVILYKFLKQ